MWTRLEQNIFVYVHKYDPLCAVSGMWSFLFFLLSSVRQLWVMDTFLWSSTAGVRTGHRSVLSSCSSSATRLTCGKLCATFGTDSQRARSTPWARAPVQDSSCPTWASAAPPAMWRLRPACLPCSAARAGLRAARPGRSTGRSCFTKKSAWASRVIGRIMFLSVSSKYLCLHSGLFRIGRPLSADGQYLSLRMLKHFSWFYLMTWCFINPEANSRHPVAYTIKDNTHHISNIPNF